MRKLLAILILAIGLAACEISIQEPIATTSTPLLNVGWICNDSLPPSWPDSGSCEWFPQDSTEGWSPRITPCQWGNFMFPGTIDLHSEHNLGGHCARPEGTATFDGNLGFSFNWDWVGGAGWRSDWSWESGNHVRIRSVKIGYDTMVILCEGTLDGPYAANRCTGRKIVLRSWHYSMDFEVPDDFDVGSFQLGIIQNIPMCNYSITNQHLPTQATYCGTIGPSGLPQAVAKSLPFDSNPIVANITTGAPCLGSPAVGGIINQNTELVYVCPPH